MHIKTVPQFMREIDVRLPRHGREPFVLTEERKVKIIYTLPVALMLRRYRRPIE